MKFERVIGIVGPLACGKSIVADYFVQHFGFTVFSLSSIVHEELKKRNIATFTRKTLQDIGDELRIHEGDDVLARRAIVSLEARGKSRVIIEGIRNPGEVRCLRSIPSFYLIAVDAPQKIRFQRIAERKKPWDPTDWEGFLKIDTRDSGDGDNAHDQQVRECMKLADATIINDTNITSVYNQIETLLREHNFLVGSDTGK